MSAIQQVLAAYGGSSSDVDFSLVVALLHMNGADGSTTFTDVKGHTFTAGGNAQIDTSQSKFNGSSGLFDGTGDYVLTPDSEDWNVGAGNFTVEFWARFNAVGAVQYLFGQNNSTLSNSLTSMFIRKDATTDKISAFTSSSGASFGGATTAAAVVVDQWYHIAYVRNGINFTLFLDGVGAASATTTSNALNNVTANLAVGRAGDKTDQTFNGWMAEFRFTKAARYTADFTPPSAAFPDS